MKEERIKAIAVEGGCGLIALEVVIEGVVRLVLAERDREVEEWVKDNAWEAVDEQVENYTVVSVGDLLAFLKGEA